MHKTWHHNFRAFMRPVRVRGKTLILGAKERPAGYQNLSKKYANMLTFYQFMVVPPFNGGSYVQQITVD